MIQCTKEPDKIYNMIEAIIFTTMIVGAITIISVIVQVAQDIHNHKSNE